MEQYRIEGIFINRRGVKRLTRNGTPHPTDIEPFTRSYWAFSPDDAFTEATADLHGGQWVDTPSITFVSEAERMRALGAPELPGLLI